MKAVDLAEKIYEQELSLKNEISISLTVPITILSFMSAAIGVFFKGFKFENYKVTQLSNLGDLEPIHSVLIIFTVSGISVIVMLLLTFWQWYKAYAFQEYRYLRTTPKHVELIDATDLEGEALDAHERSIDNSLAETLKELNIANRDTNTRRIEARKNLAQYLLWATIAFIASTAAYFVDFFVFNHNKVLL